MFEEFTHPRISFLQTCLKGLEELFYPSLCKVCGRMLFTGEKHICAHCLQEIPMVVRASETFPSVIERVCQGNPPQKLFTLFYYDRHSPYKKLIYYLKYRSGRHLANTLGYILGTNIAERCSADCIIPVPLHPKKAQYRGYNQAFEIARGVAQAMHIPILEGILSRGQNTESQTTKHAVTRDFNATETFTAHNLKTLQGKHILLIDDVITTGSTMATCLSLLREAENVRFSLACLAEQISTNEYASKLSLPPINGTFPPATCAPLHPHAQQTAPCHPRK